MAYGSNQLAAGSDDGTVVLWDLATAAVRYELKGHRGVVTGVAYSPDGLRLASAGADGTLRLWDTGTGQETRTVPGNGSPLSGVAYSPDGHLVAAAGADPTVRLWDAATGRLGGSESALCYLAEELVGKGHEIFLVNRVKKAHVSRGVHCFPLGQGNGTQTVTVDGIQELPAVDVLIVQNMAGEGRKLRALLGAKTRLCLWTGHAHDQPAVQPLHDPAERNAYDGFALVSDWQRAQFIRQFGLAPERTRVLRNAIAPAFQNLFSQDSSILKEKRFPPALVYTSTPYRGLDLLLEAFPRIRQIVPGIQLKIFSSMQLYGVAPAEDQERFGPLYRQALEMEGVEYRGSVPQQELAGQLRSAGVLAYPNTFAETSCIAVLEAMAAGCAIVTSALGALPETTAGFARLVPMNGDRETYVNRFVEQVVQVLRQITVPDHAKMENHLRKQVAFIRENYTWSSWAEKWVEFIGH